MNENTIPLNRLYEGEWARVEALDSGCMMRRRLQDIGLIEGTACRKAPLAIRSRT